MIDHIRNTKQLKVFINKINGSKNHRFKIDIWRIFLVNNNHHKKVSTILRRVGTKKSNHQRVKSLRDALKNIKNVHVGTDYSRIFYKNISDGCRHCTKDLGCTIRITTQCNRSCFFCFASKHPTENKEKINLRLIQDNIRKREKEIDFLSCAISGGEPFLFPNKVFALLKFLNDNYRDTYKRVYTNGDFVDEKILKRLKDFNVDEIRYSIKPLERPNAKLLKISKENIPHVLIEIPVLPGNESRKEIKGLIENLDVIGIDGINLLELFFNGHGIKEFKKRNYKIDISDGIRDIYDAKPIYEYPVYGSQYNCLWLLKYFAQKKANLFINYCSHQTKKMQYDAKNKRLAMNRKNNYSVITNENTHKILCIYENIELAKLRLRRHNLKFRIQNDNRHGQRLETSIDNIKLFNGKYLPIFIYRDPSDSYDVDFGLTNLNNI